MLLFSREQFFQLFADYNASIWPMQMVLVLAAVGALIASMRAPARAAIWPPLILASLWIWSGVAYHIVFFRRINPAAAIFGSLFVLQGLVLIVAAAQKHVVLRLRSSVRGWLGAMIVLYALVGYPLLGMALGHEYPAAPTFGAPCPLTIFTFGLLLWNEDRTPWYVLVIPVGWTAIGSLAAFSLGVREDLGMPMAAFVVIVAELTSRVRESVSRGRDTLQAAS
jgi:hypothetical protein